MEKTARGFRVTKFKDFYNKECSLQESSIAYPFAIWLGCDKGDHIEGRCLARMHLTQSQVKELIPSLQYFVETGELPND